MISKASCYKIFLSTTCAFLALHLATPLKLAVTIILLKISHPLWSELAGLTKSNERFAIAVGNVIAPARLSQHTWRVQGVVSHAVVWGGVEINQPVLFTGDDFQLVADSLIKIAVQEPHSHSIVVFLLQFWSNLFKWRKYRKTLFLSTIRINGIASAPDDLAGVNNLWQ